MSDSDITIGASDVDTDAIIKEARDAVARKREDGTYDAAGLDGKKRINPLEFKNDDKFLSFYLESLREAAFVDISDFEIEEKRSRFKGVFLRLKRVIWSLLKFYTYRLWSQQNQVNGLLLSGIEGIHERHQEQVSSLEKRIEELEKKIKG
jgi:hypothetical protein